MMTVPTIDRRLRVMAMARPRRAAVESALVHLADAELASGGSRRRRAEALAAAVARIALAYVRSDDFEAALEVAEAATRSPAVVQLACNPEVDVAALVRAEALRQLEARSFRHLAPLEWRAADDRLRAAIAGRLAERFRRELK